MSLIEDISKNFKHVVAPAFLIGSGILFTFIFFNKLFVDLEFLKLLIFVIAVPLPFLAVNFVFGRVSMLFIKIFRDFPIQESLNLEMFMTSCAIYLIIAVNYFYPLSLGGAITFICVTTIILEILFFVFVWLIHKIVKSRNW